MKNFTDKINLSSTLDNGTCGSKDYKQFFE